MITILLIVLAVFISTLVNQHINNKSEEPDYIYDTDFILLKGYHETPIYLNPWEVLAVTKDSSYTLIHTSNGMVYMVCESMEEVLQKIDFNITKFTRS